MLNSRKDEDVGLLMFIICNHRVALRRVLLVGRVTMRNKLVYVEKTYVWMSRTLAFSLQQFKMKKTAFFYSFTCFTHKMV